MCPFDFVCLFFSSFQPVAPKIFAGLLFQPLFPGSILPTSPANPDAQNGILPAGQAGVNPAIQGTPEGFSTTPSDIDDDFGVTAPAGIQKGMHTTQETTTGSPNGKFSEPGKYLRKVTRSVETVLSCFAQYRS